MLFPADWLSMPLFEFIFPALCRIGRHAPCLAWCPAGAAWCTCVSSPQQVTTYSGWDRTLPSPGHQEPARPLREQVSTYHTKELTCGSEELGGVDSVMTWQWGCFEDGIWDTLSSQEDYSPSLALQLCPVRVRRWASDAESLRAFWSLPWVGPGHSCPFTAMTYSLLFTKTEVDLPMDFLGSPVLRRHDSPGFVLGALSLLSHVILTIILWYRNWQGLPFTGVRTEAQRVLGTLH